MFNKRTFQAFGLRQHTRNFVLTDLILSNIMVMGTGCMGSIFMCIMAMCVSMSVSMAMSMAVAVIMVMIVAHRKQKEDVDS